MRNPLESEDAAFALLLRVLVIAAIVVAVTLVIRALG